MPTERSNIRVVLDAGLLLAIASSLFGAGVIYKTFLDQNSRLDKHDQLFQEAFQIEQQQQITVATLAQTVKDMQNHPRGGE